MAKKKMSLSQLAVWVLLGLLFIGLAGFGVGSFGSGGSAIGRVGGATITADEYARALQNEALAQQSATGEAMGVRQLIGMGIDRRVLDGLVARAALAAEAQQSGISVGDAEIARQIRQIPAFQDASGEFSRLEYELYLSRTGLRADEFEEQVREETARGLLQQAVIGGLMAPDGVVEALTAFQTETRAATLARVTEDALDIGAMEPSDEDLQTYYDENGEAFTRPETRQVTYAWIQPEMLLDEVDVVEAELLDLYEDRAEEFIQPERRLLEQLVFLEEDAAQDAVDAMAAGDTDFEVLVAERDLTLEDVDLGEVARDDLPANAAEAIFSDDTSEIIGPIETDLGWAVFRVNAVLEASEVTLEDVREDLSTELRLDAARRMIDDNRDAWDDLMVGGATLEELGDETELVLGQMDWTPASEDGIAGYDVFGETVAATEPGDFPEFFDLSDGGLFALRVDDVVPPTLPPLDEITDEVTEAWRAQELRLALQSQAQDFVTMMATEGATLEDLGLELVTEPALRRQDNVPGAPRTLSAQVFQLEAAGDLVVIPAADSAWIVRLDEIMPGQRGAVDTSILTQIVNAQVSQSMQADVFEAFGQAMQEDLGISLDQGMITAVHASFPLMALVPDFDTFAQGWAEGRNQLVYTRLAADLDTPVSLMLKLSEAGRDAFILESVTGGEVRGRYSIIGLKPDLIWECRGQTSRINREARFDRDAFQPVKTAPLDAIRAILDETAIDMPDGLPQAAAGLFGYLGYDMIRLVEHLPDVNPDPLGLPDAVLMRPSVVAVLDGVKGEVTVVSPAWVASGMSARAAYAQAAERVMDAVRDLERAPPADAREMADGPAEPAEPVSNFAHADYLAAVEKAKNYIAAGDIFQVVPSQRWSQPFTAPPFALYRALRRTNPSPFMFFFNFGGFQVIGASPEILVRVFGGEVTIRPIAGTRPRGATADEDRALEADLLADEKELAEHLMLLDLGRNDTGRVSKIGTVRPTEEFIVERYSHVMHIVSNVVGQLSDEHDALSALLAGLPAGTVSGAPKVRAMQIIDELEPEKRGIYGGGVGYFSAGGDMDMCIALRTAVLMDQTLYIQAGGGVVYDSDPEAEFQETVNKARAIRAAAAEAMAGRSGGNR